MTADLHYRLLFDEETREATPVCVQWFDLADYDEAAWVTENGVVKEFDEEADAIAYWEACKQTRRKVWEPVDAYWCRYHEQIHLGQGDDFTDEHLADMDRLYRRAVQT